MDLAFPLYTPGCSGLLKKRITDLLPGMNAAITAMLNAPPVYPLGLFVGNVRAVSAPTLVIAHAGDTSEGINRTETVRTVRFTLSCLLPHIGGDLPSEFEMARQVAADGLTWLLDSAPMLTPAITIPGLTNADGSPVTATAMLASRGTLSDIFPFLMLDGKTTAEGFQMPWTASFSLTRKG